MIVVILAAGTGKRLGLGDKAFVDLSGRSILEISAGKFDTFDEIKKAVAVVPPGLTDEAGTLLGDRWTVVVGGATRMESLERAVDALAGEASDMTVMVHDAARPFVSTGLIRRLADSFAGGDADLVAPGIASADAVKFMGADKESVVATIGKNSVVLAQTPQITTMAVLRDGLAVARDTGRVADDESQLAEWLGGDITVIPGERENFKITSPFDLKLARLLAK